MRTHCRALLRNICTANIDAVQHVGRASTVGAALSLLCLELLPSICLATPPGAGHVSLQGANLSAFRLPIVLQGRSINIQSSDDQPNGGRAAAVQGDGYCNYPNPITP